MQRSEADMPVVKDLTWNKVVGRQGLEPRTY